MAHLGHSGLSNRGKTAQEKPDAQELEVVPRRRYTKALVRKAARVA
jgi:hypothetical protein